MIHGRVLRTLFARLATRPGETVSRQLLVEALWDGDAPRTAITTLRSHLTRLRTDLREGGLPDLVVTRGNGFFLDAPAAALDAARFEALARDGRDALAAGDGAVAVRSLGAALALWRGEALEDCRASEWTRAEASRLGELRLAATEDLLDARIAVGELATAAAELESFVNRFPFRERAWELLMNALYRAGRQADALAAFRRARAMLVDELGIEPGPGLRGLESSILAGDGPRNLSEPEPIVGIRSPRTGNLPAETTSFVGRRDELAEAKKWLTRSRMVTLTGVGGVGKSRLALRVAADLRAEFPDGAWLVELAGLRDPELVAHAVADALNIVDRIDNGSIDSVVRDLRDAKVLLILDNCEHLLNACAQIASTLLKAAPDLRVLATSRQPLAVPGEHILPVPPLLVPDDDDGDEDLRTAMTLFADRANAAVPGGFEVQPDNSAVVARICRQLDGIPLAIELAAVRLRVLSPAELLDRLDDRLKLLASGRSTALPRHQTLRATIDWSFNLCTPEEQALWTRLSVFAGTFDLASAEAVCAADDTGHDFLSVVDGLVDKSILIREEHSGEVRFRLLAVLGGYGRDRLRAEGLTAEVLTRHRDWYLSVAEEGARNWFGPGQLDWLARLRRDHANLRAALDFSLTTPGEHLAGTRLAAALHSFWVACDQVSEGQHWLDLALKVCAEPSRERARALWVCGRVTYLQGDLDGGVAKLSESLALAVGLGHTAEATHATHLLGAAALLRDDPTGARALLVEAAGAYRELEGPSSTCVMVDVHLAMSDVFLGDIASGLARVETALAVCESRGEHWTRSYALYALAFAQWRAGDLARARRNAREALRLKAMFREIGGLAMVVDLLAWIAVGDGSGEEAAVLLGVAVRSWALVGVPWFGSKSWRRPHEEAQARARCELGHHVFEDAFRRGWALSREDGTALALGAPQRGLRAATTDPR
ncbi:BTAD domain-containing putative transcriptional regulator [Saccharothrix lopnurensis]|uniref:BTAD domain-containing putative transcriptional regulator n=1 Tax=Saccharothrix lopnurensis TaxID=1670621 RepID=A0ABW1P3Q4_9PSEU